MLSSSGGLSISTVILLKRISDFILFSNVFIALGAVGLTYSSIQQLKLNTSKNTYLLLVFFATLFIYNFQRLFYKNNKESASIRRIWINKNQHVIKLHTAIGFLGTCITFLYSDYKLLLYLSPLLLLSIVYFTPFIKLRKHPLLKLLTLVLVWTMVTATTPLLLANESITVNHLLHIAERFFFMTAICIPFDIRDLHVDKAESIQTLPYYIGEKKAKNIALLCISVSGIVLIMEYVGEMINIKTLTALLLSTLVTAILIAITSSKRNEYFYVAGIDGTMLIQGVLMLAISLY
jgi:4-hydroxybenzoate polyprenyltransferase